MRKLLLLLLFVCFCGSLFSQSFFDLSRPEKFWTVAHIFVAKSAFMITTQVKKDIDSLKSAGSVGADNNGGELDAVKHAYWMACVAWKIGPRRAEKLGKAHERGNYLQYKKHFREDNIMPDSMGSVMDLHNNCEGISVVGKSRAGLTRKILLDRVIASMEAGGLMVLRKDMHGNFLSCDGAVIRPADWTGKWSIPKCMVPSGQ